MARWKKQGFTLLEVMIVVAVISILAVVAVPRYQATLDHYRLDAAARNLAERIRYAKQLAMDQRRNIGVGFSGNTLEVVPVTLSGNGQPDVLAPLERLSLDSGVMFSSATGVQTSQDGLTQYIYFDYRGFVQTNPPGSAAAFLLSGVRGQRVQVEVEAGTGQARVVW